LGVTKQRIYYQKIFFVHLI